MNSKNNKTIYILSGDWTGLHDMFECEDWSKMAGVPLVPLYWKGLVEYGYNVHVIICGNFTNEKEFIMEGINFHLLSVPQWTLAGINERKYMSYFKIAWVSFQFKVYITINKISKYNPPDFIYSYQPTFVPIGHYFSMKYHVPHALHLWGTWMGHYILKEPWYKRFPVIGSIIALKFPLDLLIISNDGTEGDKVIEKLKFPKDKFRFWLDGTSPCIYNPNADIKSIKKSVGIEETDKMIFQAARLDNWKRIDRAISAMPHVIQKLPNAKLVIAGDGHLRATLEKQAIELGVSDHVLFLGFVKHSTIIDLFNAADVFITVQDLTNLGNQLLEAMHSKTCIIAYDIGGISSIMKNGETGILLKENELNLLSENIIYILENNIIRNQFASCAYSYAKENIWTWEERINEEIQDVNLLIEKYKTV